MKSKTNQPTGSASILLAVLMIPLMGLLAFSIDYGFLLFIKTELQRTADQAAIAAVRDLTPDANGYQDLDKVRETVRQFVELNLGDGFAVPDADIEIGRFDPVTIYNNLDLLETGPFDTVRVTLRRDDATNTTVSLFFARLINTNAANVIARSTAVLQRARYLGPGAKVFPFAIEQQAWDALPQGETATIFGDGRIEDENGDPIPGNWGTVDIGPDSNSTTSLSDQIEYGLTQNDMDALYQQGDIPNSASIDASEVIRLNGDTGLSSGLKHSVNAVAGEMKIAPIYQSLSGHGGNLRFKIVGWAAIQVVTSNWHGSQNSNVVVRKSFTYDKSLFPVSDLSDTTNVIQGTYTTPVLIQ